ncbi:MAG: NrfD/PsrC family molybdoenzyme membrane anchor subunit [Symbiobacteriia bacterium]
MHEISWGFLIVLYLFLAGVSAGAFATSATIFLTQGERHRGTALWGALLAPFPAAIGTGLLVLDLGRPLAFYWLFTTLRLTSPMSFGVWFLSAFLLLSVIYFFLWLPQNWRAAVASFLPRAWRARAAADDAGLRHTRRILAGVGLPFALGVAIYTAILLGASTRPLWGSPLMPFLFLFSALSTGLAAVMVSLLLARLVSARFAGRLAAGHGYAEVHAEAAATASEAVAPMAAAHDPEMRLLLVSDLVLLGVELSTLLLMILYSRIGTLASRQAWDVMLSGDYVWVFWLGPVLTGILAPIALEVMELRHSSRGANSIVAKPAGPVLGLLTGTLVLMGGFLLRYVIVYAGQVYTWAAH